MDLADRAQQAIEGNLDAELSDRRRRMADVSHVTECEECGEPIPHARRKAVPSTRWCVDCADVMERRR